MPSCDVTYAKRSRSVPVASSKVISSPALLSVIGCEPSRYLGLVV